MKSLLFILPLAFSLFACQSQQATSQSGNQFGEKITADNAISVAQLITQAEGKEQITAKVKGVVEAVCQVKGCWMTLIKPDGTSMRVTFKDYGFFMPKDISGKTIVARGRAQVETTDVATLKHYAEDEGLPAKEIEKITEPEVELTFEADGVIIL